MENECCACGQRGLDLRTAGCVGRGGAKGEERGGALEARGERSDEGEAACGAARDGLRAQHRPDAR